LTQQKNLLVLVVVVLLPVMELLLGIAPSVRLLVRVVALNVDRTVGLMP
jgi:hypothetical protein